MANTEQMHKQITTHTKAKKACIQVSYYQLGNDNKNSNKQDDAATLLLEKTLTQLVAANKGVSKYEEKGAGQQKSVLLLARFNFQLPDRKMLTALSAQYPQLDIKAMTVHSSKGQEADNVIVLAMEAGEHGFPCHKRRHPFALILQPDSSEFPDAEERRLLYVALTRARQQVYLLCNKGNPSSFVEELVTGDYAVTIAK